MGIDYNFKTNKYYDLIQEMLRTVTKLDSTVGTKGMSAKPHYYLY